MILTASTFEQSWFFDSMTGLMKATVDYDHIFLLDGSGNATTTTLADYLIANPPSVGDTWTVVYTDNDGGPFRPAWRGLNFLSMIQAIPALLSAATQRLPTKSMARQEKIPCPAMAAMTSSLVEMAMTSSTVGLETTCSMVVQAPTRRIMVRFEWRHRGSQSPYTTKYRRSGHRHAYEHRKSYRLQRFPIR